MTRWKRSIPFESEEQASLFKWVDGRIATLPELGMMFHVPNGGLRPEYVGAQLKAQGVKCGVPDLFLMVPRGGFHGLVIELKRMGERPSPEQNDWLNRLNAQGYRATVACGWDDARQVIERYLGQGNGKLNTETAKSG